jgi:hypothetical protein
MCLGINLECMASGVFLGLPMNTSAPSQIRPIKLNYRVKAPLSARTKIDAPTSVRIPRGSLIQWFARPSNDLGFTNVRWLQDDYIVSDAELNQNCERVLD